MTHELSNSQFTIKINPQGAELCSVISTAYNIEYMWEGKKEVWSRHAPILFPIVGRLKENTCYHNSIPYTLSQHGFARDKEFRLVEKTKSSLTYELTDDELTRTIFPFRFLLHVIYELVDNTLTVTYKVSNCDASTMYFSIGAHPGFKCPLLPNETFEDYYLEFDKQQLAINKLNNGLLTNEQEELLLDNNTLTLTSKLFDKDALVFVNQPIHEVSLRSKLSQRGIKVIANNFPYWGIWSKKGCREFVCIEPWYGITDFDIQENQELKNKQGIIELPPNQLFSCNYTLFFD